MWKCNKCGLELADDVLVCPCGEVKPEETVEAIEAVEAIPEVEVVEAPVSEEAIVTEEALEEGEIEEIAEEEAEPKVLNKKIVALICLVLAIILGTAGIFAYHLKNRYVKITGDSNTITTTDVKNTCDSIFSEDIAMKRIMKDNNFKENTKVKDAFIASVDSTILEAKYQVASDVNTDQVVFKIGNQSYKLQDFVDYIVANQKRQGFKTSTAYAYELYNDFVKSQVFEYEDSQLENKYPEFKNLVQEYHDGILLFSLMEEQVWNKAVLDTVGLQEYYEKNKHLYMWKDRVKAIVVTCTDKDDVEEIKQKLVESVDADALRAYLKGNNIPATLRFAFYQKGDNVNIDATEWTEGAIAEFDSSVDNTTQIIKIVEVRPSEPKTFKEAKGLVTSGYQNELEKQWLQQLRDKYPVQLNQKVLKKINKNYK